ncbi:hypothetical protein V6259_02535 [Marinomonas sp. TI.3.20]|uniref:hypothetical protein n=1 Tax=Marinomonas sp. TI.3.20 TaxID=3121296 RepID=UPI00311FAAEE
MADYQPYLSINIRHSYFSSYIAQQIDVIPTFDTQQWLETNQMFIKNISGGICIFFDPDKLNTPSSDKNSQYLQFKVFSGDSYFRNYTNTPLPQSLCTAEFDIVVNRSENSDATPKQWLSPEELLDHPEKKIISPYELSQNLIGLINIEIPANYYYEANKHITLSYEHCETYWKYYFLSLKHSNQFKIDDPKKTYSFEFQGVEKINNQSDVMTFISQTPIPIYQRSDMTFQLRNQYHPVLRRLPVADPKQMELITQGNNYQRLCHIYVA